MRYKPEYDDFSETNKFLDEIFREECEIGWSSDCPQNDSHNALNVTVVKPEGAAEKTYIASLVSEISEKLAEILDIVDDLPNEKDRSVLLTKEDLISRLISVSNTLDFLKQDAEEASNKGVTTAIIGGGCPFSSMF